MFIVLTADLIPRSAVPLRYWLTYFAASICPGEQLELHCAIMLVVIVDMSGRV